MHTLTMRRAWEDILEQAKQQGVVTPADVRALGLAAENLNKLAKLGKLHQIGRGIYEHPEFEATEHHSYVEVAKTLPHGVICLLSALSIHGVGAQMPWEVWVAIPRGRRIPKTRLTRIRAVSMSGPNYELGVEQDTFEGVAVNVYSLEKTIIDCFRLRRLIGHDVAVEALRETISNRRINVSKLIELADQLRSRRLIQPYIEAMV